MDWVFSCLREGADGSLVVLREREAVEPYVVFSMWDSIMKVRRSWMKRCVRLLQRGNIILSPVCMMGVMTSRQRFRLAMILLRCISMVMTVRL